MSLYASCCLLCTHRALLPFNPVQHNVNAYARDGPLDLGFPSLRCLMTPHHKALRQSTRPSSRWTTSPPSSWKCYTYDKKGELVSWSSTPNALATTSPPSLYTPESVTSGGSPATSWQSKGRLGFLLMVCITCRHHQQRRATTLAPSWASHDDSVGRIFYPWPEFCAVNLVDFTTRKNGQICNYYQPVGSSQQFGWEVWI